jgi:hypothetical protein
VSQQYTAINFQPRSSPLLQQLRSVPDLLRNTSERLRGKDGGVTPVPVAYEDRIYWYARAVELDTWWAWWNARGDPLAGYLFLLAPAGALAITALTWRRLRSLERRERQRRDDVEPSTPSLIEGTLTCGPPVTATALGP